MTPITLNDFEVTVTSISSQGDFGGAYLWGRIDKSLAATITKYELSVNVKGNYKYFPKDLVIIPGDRWLINGACIIENRKNINGYIHTVLTVNVSSASLVYCAEYSLEMMLQEIPGMGLSKTQQLLKEFGEENLRYHLEAGDQLKIEKVLTPDMSDRVIQWWKNYGASDDYRFFMRFGLSARDSRLITDFYCPYPKQRLSEDPYAILSFFDNLPLVDRLALTGYNLLPDDQRRLYAFAEKSVFDLVAKGNTACYEDELKNQIRKNISKINVERPALKEVISSIRTYGSGQIVYDDETKLVSPVAAYGIERDISHHITRLLNSSAEPNLPRQVKTLTSSDIDYLLNQFDENEQLRLGIPNFKLNKKQRKAVEMALNNRVSIITGDAGTGKTSVLRALYDVLDHCNFTYYQCAISGRATKRLREATDRHDESYTVAGLIRSIRKIDNHDPRYVIVDESAMVDAWNLWKLLNTLGACSRIILVGDPAQLAPVGAGLTLHLLAEVASIPQVTLEEIVRQDDGCEIPLLTRAMRSGDWILKESSMLQGVELINCGNSNIFETVVSLYGSNKNDTQILSATYHGRYAGITAINELCQTTYNPDGKPVISFNLEHEAYQHHGLKVGDPVIMTENDWNRDLANGSLGEVIEAYDEPQAASTETQEETLSLGLIRWDDGNIHPILLDDVDPERELIQLAYCLSVHKAQGSEFKRVIIPVPDTRSLIIDRCWLYTAITRAKSSVVLVGDPEHIAKVVSAPPKSQSRTTALESMIQNLS